MAHASADIGAYLKAKDSVSNEFSGSVYNYMRLLSQIKNVDLTKRLTNQYLQAAPRGTYAPDAIIARIANDLPNDEGLVKFYMDSLDTRYDLMKAYYEQKQIDKIPEPYRRQDEFAKLCLYKYITTDDEDGGTSTDMKLLGTIFHDENVYYTFEFSLAGDEDHKVMIGIAGPYQPGSTKLSFDKYFAYTTFEVVKPDWRAQASAMIGPLTDIYK